MQLMFETWSAKENSNMPSESARIFGYSLIEVTE